MNASPLFVLPLENIVEDSPHVDAPINPRRSTLLLLLARVVLSDMTQLAWPKQGINLELLPFSRAHKLPPATQELYRLLACSTESGTPPLVMDVVEGIRSRGWDDAPSLEFRRVPEAQRLELLKVRGVDLSREDFFGRENALRFLSMLQRKFFREQATERLEAAFAILGLYAAEQAGYYWQRKDVHLSSHVRTQLSEGSRKWFDLWDRAESKAPFEQLFRFIRSQAWDTWSRYPGLISPQRRMDIAGACGFPHLTQQGALALVDASVQYLQRLKRL